MAYARKIDLYTTAVVFANVFYLLRKKYGIEKSRELLRKLRSIIRVLPVNEKIIDDALVSKITDFECSHQYFCAKEHNIPVIITRNIKDYREKGLAVQTADEYITGATRVPRTKQ